jgi:hypothetical protein
MAAGTSHTSFITRIEKNVTGMAKRADLAVADSNSLPF